MKFEDVGLPGTLSDRALGDTIQVDANAARFYDDTKFIDGADSHQLVAPVRSGDTERVDLVTAVMRELGQVLSFEHSHSYDLTDAELPWSMRWSATEWSGSKVDAFYELFGNELPS